MYPKKIFEWEKLKKKTENKLQFETSFYFMKPKKLPFLFIIFIDYS